MVMRSVSAVYFRHPFDIQPKSHKISEQTSPKLYGNSVRHGQVYQLNKSNAISDLTIQVIVHSFNHIIIYSQSAQNQTHKT
jgi:hypothetical protein